MTKRIAVTGGAGFVGSNLACMIAREHPGCSVVALDNLKRRGSELTLSRLAAAGVEFLHGDVRIESDLAALGAVDCLIECSAEPSVLAGQDGAPGYVLDTNLTGALNCLEHLRRQGGEMIFLSSSRVYYIPALTNLPLEERGDRLEITEGAAGPGWSDAGIAESFSTTGPRSLYGATKLAAEQFIEEYRAAYELRAVVYRCGVLTGPWQMGKVDQGVITLWLARHLFGGTLAYIGHGGDGRQVRDLLHVADLYDLIAPRLDGIGAEDGQTYNVGGGMANSVSLRELTRHCERLTGNTLAIDAVPETRANDIGYYVTDNAKAETRTGWRPKRTLEETLEDIHRWLVDNRAQLEPILKGDGT
ncbi:MAG: NAD-dependent epimerase/dehydratase family protein [Alphaproteobacteria bacterium]|nr:NAD-dependent epimerase/dehydratase family protein [Alphaproteobacteria bacterium]